MCEHVCFLYTMFFYGGLRILVNAIFMMCCVYLNESNLYYSQDVFKSFTENRERFSLTGIRFNKQFMFVKEIEELNLVNEIAILPPSIVYSHLSLPNALQYFPSRVWMLRSSYSQSFFYDGRTLKNATVKISTGLDFDYWLRVM